MESGSFRPSIRSRTAAHEVSSRRRSPARFPDAYSETRSCFAADFDVGASLDGADGDRPYSICRRHHHGMNRRPFRFLLEMLLFAGVERSHIACVLEIVARGYLTFDPAAGSGGPKRGQDRPRKPVIPIMTRGKGVDTPRCSDAELIRPGRPQASKLHYRTNVRLGSVHMAQVG
jgi:hypothetical protein